jgi:hypothetical protein
VGQKQSIPRRSYGQLFDLELLLWRVQGRIAGLFGEVLCVRRISAVRRTFQFYGDQV